MSDEQRIRAALKAIVDCYSAGYQDRDRLLEDLGFFILEGKAILEGTVPRWRAPV